MNSKSPRRMSPGFSLIELMIVVAIIGIMASIAIPNFLTFRCKAKAAEANSILGTLKHFQAAYLAENDVYFCPIPPNNLDSLVHAGFDFSRAQYHVMWITCTPGDQPPTYVAQMQSTWTDQSGGRDTWVVTETGNLMHSYEGCH